MAALFQPNLLDWLFGSGVGTNIGAAILCALIAYLWSLTKFWPLHAIHARLDAIHLSHVALHAKLDEHAKLHAATALKIEALHQRVSEDGRSARQPRRGGRSTREP